MSNSLPIRLFPNKSTETPKVVFLMGTTACGKTDLSIHWAKKTHGAIINCDSIQVYKGLDIGSAKPTLQQMEEVPHYLFSYVPKGNEISVGQYVRDFFSTLDCIKDKFPYIFVVGGTGFYFQTIERGLLPVGASDPKIKNQLFLELTSPNGPKNLYRELMDKDPVSAQKISPQDHYRLVRFLEIIRINNKPFSEILSDFNARPFPYPLTKIGIKMSPELLLQRVISRTENMLQLGLVEETKKLLEEGYENWKPLRSVGYKEASDFIKLKKENHLKEDWIALRQNVIKSTMQLVKKQKTWFQRDQDIQWVTLENSVKDLENSIMDLEKWRTSTPTI